MSAQLTKRFIKGLKKYGLTFEEVNKHWKYCGGNRGRHLNYLKLNFKDIDLPEPENECVCGQRIKENCYIIDDAEERILVLGNCCIHKFIEKCGRTCKICGEPHKNRIVNRCHQCRIGICDVCDRKCNPKYKTCWKCTFDKNQQ